MLNKIIEFSIKNKLIIGIFTLILLIEGIYSLTRLSIDALPDITNNQVQIITTAPTLASQEVEQLITYPIEQTLKTIPEISELRSISRFGLSVITIVFKEEADIYWAREQVFQRLQQAKENIPEFANKSELAPITTGLGEIYQYYVYTKKGYEHKYSITDLRTIQDWIITPQLQGLQGVAEVSSWGGKLKQYEISVNPDQLNSLGITIAEIFDALKKNNQNTGGAYIEKEQYAYIIRGVGMAKNNKDLENIVITNRKGVPVLIRDVGVVREGSAIRYGAATKDGKGETVCGIVLMLKGENSMQVVDRVKQRIQEINKSLPEGVLVEPFIDRSKLVDTAIGTISKNLIEGALIVILVLILFLGNLRAGLIVASVIPLSMLFAVIMMNAFGISGNLMSLGAIDFGIIVDGAVIIVEATLHHLFKFNRDKKLTQSEMDAEVYNSASKIRSSAAFGEIIILIVYLPILALVGIEGKMFKPMAQTVGFAILGAFILSLTYVPMISSLFLSKKIQPKVNFSDRLIKALERRYNILLKKALKVKRTILFIVFILFIVAIFIFSRMGGVFIPTLEEGDLAINVNLMTGASLDQTIETTTRYEKMLKQKFPEIKTIVAKIGSGEIPTDPMPMESADLFINLKPKKEWNPKYRNWEDIANAMKREMEIIPGVGIEISQPVQMRFNELMTGSRSDVAIKIYGDDLDSLANKANELINRVKNIEGVGDLKADQIVGLPQITVVYDYDKLALYGLNVEDINKILRASFAGEISGQIYEEGRCFDIVVRLDKSKRTDISDVNNLFVPLPSGEQIPISQIADIKYEQGPVQINREEGKRKITIGLNVRGRDVKTVVNEIQNKLGKELKLPPGYYVEYGGQFENLIEASKRLSIAVPVALFFIFILLYFTFSSIKQASLIFTAVPLSAIGGVFALWLRGMPFSISAGIGFIALFGIAVLNGIVLISYFNQLKKEGILDPVKRVFIGTQVRLRPVLMTATVASLGFFPMALSNSGGSEVQKPLATVVIGGLLSATFLTLIVLPILYLLVESNMRNIKVSKSKVTLLLLLCSSFIFSQTKVSLSEAIELAKKNNLEIKITDKEIEKQTVLKKSAFETDPLQLEYTGGQINTRSIYDNSISLTQYFPLGKLTKANRQLQEELVKLSENQKALTSYEIEKAITLSYYQYLYGIELEKLNVEFSKIYIQFLTNAELRFKTGESGKVEVISAKAKVKEIETIREQLKNDLEIYKKQFQYFIQTEENIIPDKTTNWEYIFTADNKFLIEDLLNNYYKKQIDVLNKETQVYKAKSLPTLGIGYTVETNDKVYLNTFLAGIQFPLFNKANRARIEGVKITQYQAELELSKQKLKLQSQIEQLKNSYDKNMKGVEYYKKEGLLYAKEMINAAQKSYANGDMGYWEYTSILNQAIDIKKQYIEAMYLLNQSAINLQYPSLN